MLDCSPGCGSRCDLCRTDRRGAAELCCLGPGLLEEHGKLEACSQRGGPGFQLSQADYPLPDRKGRTRRCTGVLPGFRSLAGCMGFEPRGKRCQACGNCVLGTTGGICPIACCAKSLLNGPCGGSQNGVCEVDPDTPCAWQLIYDRMAALGRLDLLLEVNPMKDWRTSRDGGARKIVREDLRL